MKRTASIAIAGSAVLALAVCGGIVWALTRPPSPQDGAHRYLTALATGDYEAVAALRDDSTSSESDSLVEQAFSGATEYLSDPRVEEVTMESETRAGVRATGQLDGSVHTVFFALTLVDGSWRLYGDFLAQLEVTSALGESVRVGNALVPVATGVALLPAVYPVMAAPPGLLTGEATVLVTNETPLTVALDTIIAPGAAVKAQGQLAAYAAQCTQPAAAVPTNCGLRVPWAADLARLDQITFRIDEMPVAAISDNGREFAAVGGVVVATATGLTREDEPASVTYRADDWALRGSVMFQGEEMILRVE